MKSSTKRSPPGIQSVEVAGSLLRALIDLSEPSALGSIAAKARMPPTKARRYLVSLMRLGLAEQDQVSGQYELGPLAMSIGLAALSRFDVVREAGDRLTDIRNRTGESAFLSVRGGDGVTIIQFRENLDPLPLRARVGASLPLLTTATGWVFISFDPEIEMEISTAKGPNLAACDQAQGILLGCASVAERAVKIRSDGYVHMGGVYQTGVSAISAPVIGLGGELLAALTVVLPRERATAEHVGRIGTLLREQGSFVR